MPRPNPLSPADLRPGQRVRITRRRTPSPGRRGWSYSIEGEVRLADEDGVSIWGHSIFVFAAAGTGITQTIEVIE